MCEASRKFKLSNETEVAELLSAIRKQESNTYQELLTKKQVAERYGLTDRILDELTKKHLIPIVRVNQRVVRFRVTDIERYLSRCTIPAVGAL